MKLFSLPDGTVDRKDRAQWLTPIFDMSFGAAAAVVNGPYYVSAAGWWIPGQVAGQAYAPGSASGQAYVPGAVKGQAS